MTATTDRPVPGKGEVHALEAVFAAQQGAFARDTNPGHGRRREDLDRLRGAVVAHGERLAKAVAADYGSRSPDETRLLELVPVIAAIGHAARHLKSWMRPARRRVPLFLQPASGRVVVQPLGVIGIVAPWNYPLSLSLGPLVCALAAGNRAIIKMPGLTPITTAALQAALGDAFPEDKVAVVPSAQGVSAAFTRLPFDHLLFTGSPEVGRTVMRAAADELTPVTLELGGKSPAIVGLRFPIERAARQIVYGKTVNAGQTCVAPDYVLCPHDRLGTLVEQMQIAFRRMFPSLGDNPDYTCIVDDHHLERLRALLDDAARKGAEIVAINPANEDLSRTRKLPLHVVLGATDDMAILKEEIFGPLLPILTYRSLDEVIAYVRARPRPLALYYFDRDRHNVERILAETISGTVAINDTITQFAVPTLPFGGVGDSGMGQYHGREGFLTFSKQKGVFLRPRLHFGDRIYPPYGGFVRTFAARMLR